MQYQVLARKWRPSLFGEVRGQDHVLQAIKGIFKAQQFPQSYLFTGTRGVGKTTLARILAKALNCSDLQNTFEPCLKCSSCHGIHSGNNLDYQEVDGASHNGVEDIRGILDSLQYLPTIGRFRVFVIDEVHMLSISAFNALLKNLEEPPEHVIFIFATTDPEKIPETVLSRLLRFDLRSISVQALEKVVLEICQKEGISFDQQSTLSALCKAGMGSLRDTLTYLEQLKAQATDQIIHMDDLNLNLGLMKSSALKTIVGAIAKRDLELLSATYLKCLEENIDVESFTSQISDYYFDLSQRLMRENSPKLQDSLNFYQTLSRDFKWAIESLYPERAVLVALQKGVLSLGIKTYQHSENGIQHEATENVTQKRVVVKKNASFDFLHFLKFLSNTRAASSANLELGNLVNASVSKEQAQITFGFPEKCRLMYDYFHEKDVRQGVIDSLARYLDLAEELIELKFEIFDSEEMKKKSFKSIADINYEVSQKSENELKADFTNSKVVLELARVFGKPIENIRVES
jgi:DNA polymerase-3 subunit gamma/tau